MLRCNKRLNKENIRDYHGCSEERWYSLHKNYEKEIGSHGLELEGKGNSARDARLGASDLGERGFRAGLDGRE